VYPYDIAFRPATTLNLMWDAWARWCPLVPWEARAFSAHGGERAPPLIHGNAHSLHCKCKDLVKNLHAKGFKQSNFDFSIKMNFFFISSDRFSRFFRVSSNRE
jgi:hypothetical protein